jgi:hypothetical protein
VLPAEICEKSELSELSPLGDPLERSGVAQKRLRFRLSRISLVRGRSGKVIKVLKVIK